MTFRLDGKVAVVTGVGRATAAAFAHEGADVLGINIAGAVGATLDMVQATSDELARTGRLVEAASRRWMACTLDRRDLPALRRAAADAAAAWGRIGILFANAGIQGFKPTLEWEDADWHDRIEVNLTGTASALRAVTPHIVEGDRGGHTIITAARKAGTALGSAPPTQRPSGASSA